MTSDSDPTVVLQVMMTSKLLNWPDWKKNAQAIIDATTTPQGVKDIANPLLQDLPHANGKFEPNETTQINHGQDIYRSQCFTCHGFDGKGMQAWGQNPLPIAPSLAGSKTVEQGDAMLHVLLQGLAGPLNGKTYETHMVSLASNNDDWIADVTCFVRKAFGNMGALVTKDDVKRVREASKSRNKPWTNDEICACYPTSIGGDRKQWKLTASHGEKDLSKAVDGDANSRWSTGKPQEPGMWLQIELPSVADVAGLVLDTKPSANDSPRAYTVELSNDGSTWDPPIVHGEGRPSVTQIQFPRPAKAKFIKITQTGDARTPDGKGNFWSINELQVLKPGAN
jgi:mono/diheme cytochrome c family protein